MSKGLRYVLILFTLALLVAPAAILAEEPADSAASTAGDFHGPRLLPDCKATLSLPSSVRRAVGDTVLVFQAIVLKDGTVGYAELMNDDRPYPGVEQAALQSFRNWKYEPGKLAGEAVDAGVTISVQFRGAAAAASTRPAETWYLTSARATIQGLDSIILGDGLRASSPRRHQEWKHNTTTVQRLPGCSGSAGPYCLHEANQPPHNEAGEPGAMFSRR
jgi:hypothetical protein